VTEDAINGGMKCRQVWKFRRFSTKYLSALRKRYETIRDSSTVAV